MDINLNLLPIFEAVYRTRSMTIASQELFLTQSGVSQHIKTLEEYLGVTLFDRYRHKIVPTSKGDEFYKYCEESLFLFKQGVADISNKSRVVKGTVKIGMPIEFGNSIILPLLAEFHRLHPEVIFEFELGFASLMNSMLLAGSLDFAFVDDFKMDTVIDVEPIHEEYLELCVHPDLIDPSRISKKTFNKLNYIEYAKGNDVLKLWFESHYQFHPKLNVVAYIMDVQGLAKLIVEGVGAGVLPRYVVSKLRQRGKKIYTFRGSGKVLRNSIRLAALKNRTHSIAASEALEWLREHLTKMMQEKRKGLKK